MRSMEDKQPTPTVPTNTNSPPLTTVANSAFSSAVDVVLKQAPPEDARFKNLEASLLYHQERMLKAVESERQVRAFLGTLGDILKMIASK